MGATNKQIMITELPDGQLEERHFSQREASVPKPGDGEVLVRTLFLSLDAANRAWMQGATYTAPVLAGELMRGGTLSEVVASKVNGFAPGDIVECPGGWQEYSVHEPKAIGKIEVRGPLSQHLSILGITGLTAYFGLLEVGQPREGETIVVSAAAGAVGNVVGQIGKIKGCRVVGVAGSDEKCEWLTKELGFDAALNYKSVPPYKGLKENCPEGIDVYFDNTGGDILEAVLFRMNQGGRIACCGAVSQYDVATPSAGPRGIPGLLVVKRLRMEGFIVSDYFKEGARAQATDELAGWAADGRLKVKEDIIDGLENAPRSLIGLLHGENLGKRMIRVAEPSMSSAEEG